MLLQNSNLQEIEKALLVDFTSIEAISFDVFDTLVQRTLPHPDVTKVPAARKLQSLLQKQSINSELDTLLGMRLEIELELRNRAAGAGDDPECRIDDVFYEWIVRAGLVSEEEGVQALLKAELNAELRVVYPTPGMTNLIKSLHERRIPLFFVTDMYLRKWMVEKILQRCGYGNSFSQGFVSCEVNKGKYSGKLFQQILDEQGLKASNLVHVGDRRKADIQGAAKCNIRALHFTDSVMLERHATQAYVNSIRTRDPFWQGSSWSQWSIAPTDRITRCGDDLRYRIGYLCLGPLFTNFIHRVLNQVNEAGVELVLLNSREGFLLQELYKRIAGALPGSSFPPTQYAYLTRKSIYAASLKSFGEREIDMGFHTITPSLRNMFVRFSLPEKDLEDLALSVGFKSIDEELKRPLKSRKLKAMISDPHFLAVLKRTRDHVADLAYDYLAQIGYWNSQTVAVVDVGWNGTTQEALSLAFSDLAQSPKIEGYYMALLGDKEFKATSKSKYTGIYHDYRNNSFSSPFARFLELFETACRAPHATVIGFKREPDGKVIPVFKERTSIDFQQEQKDEALIASIQSGILDYAEDYTKTLDFQDRDPAVYSEYFLFKLDRLLRFPTKQEAQVLSSFSHSEDFGQSLVHVADSPVSGLSENEQTEKLRQRVLWREGSMVNKPVPGLNRLLNYYRIFRTRRY